MGCRFTSRRGYFHFFFLSSFFYPLAFYCLFSLLILLASRDFCENVFLILSRAKRVERARIVSRVQFGLGHKSFYRFGVRSCLAIGNLRYRRFRGDGDRTGRASLEQRLLSLPSKIRTLRSQWTQEDGALEDYRRGRYGYTRRINRINPYLHACNNNNSNNNFISVFPR